MNCRRSVLVTMKRAPRASKSALGLSGKRRRSATSSSTRNANDNARKNTKKIQSAKRARLTRRHNRPWSGRRTSWRPRTSLNACRLRSHSRCSETLSLTRRRCHMTLAIMRAIFAPCSKPLIAVRLLMISVSADCPSECAGVHLCGVRACHLPRRGAAVPHGASSRRPERAVLSQRRN